MFKINDNYQKLPGSYLFSTIAKKVSAYSAANPDKQIIRLGIGDVTQPIAPAIIDAMHKAVDEMGHAETFHGYAPDLGYDFLRNAIVANDYKARGSDIFKDYQLSVSKDKRLSGTWTLEQYEGQYRAAMYAAVKSANPNWKPGQAFDTSILDNVTRESVEATLVQNGNRIVRNSIDVSV